MVWGILVCSGGIGMITTANYKVRTRVGLLQGDLAAFAASAATQLTFYKVAA